ncbi:MAG: L-asparaginase [uncultured Gemmatimonadetes bacterium]|uniref:L-asparaginase n=1 Tax=uncultured Gemmatimonadota bacterium TaxID=203437 RepID=A0A6J4KQE4_9BACT|nr:MAG: L-asparaginase [uncultured Gemmatimonadota bacterium]
MAEDGALPRVVLIATGGTISMRIDPERGGAVPRLTGSEILHTVPGVEEVARLEVREFGRYPGPHMTIDRMWELRRAILDAIGEGGVDGVVVTHGTDTIEETAYLLDRSLPAETPVVITGAMRNSSELSWDGPANLMSAVEVAASREARGRGTMVVMDEEIVQGAEVVKTHTEAAGTFRSPNWGPLGITDKGRVLFYRESRRKRPLEPETPIPAVDLVKVVAGMDARLVEASLDSGARGIVLEALGRGNVPPAVVPGIRRWVDAGRPVVVASRSARGRVLDTYAYPGGGHELREMGAIFADHMTGQQARIELMLALGVFGDELARVRDVVEAGRYGE